MLPEGERASDFTLPGTEGGQEFEEYRLSNHTDAGAVILVFYPLDFSPVCTTELCEFRDAEWLALTKNVDVFGISRDSCYAHSQFIDQHNLTFPLLSDIEGEIIEGYGVNYDEWNNHSGVAKRSIFIIDANDTIRYAWETEDAYEHPDLDEVANELTTLSTVTVEGE